VNYFIDCGSNLGQGLTKFHNQFNILDNPGVKIFCFEPNPEIDLSKAGLPSNVVFYQQAVWTTNTKLKFRRSKRVYDYKKKLDTFGSDSKPGELTSVGCHLDLDDIIQEMAVPEVTDIVEIDAIDFCEFLDSLRKESPDGEISIKMDIEGAEFPVLRDMLERNAFSNVSNIWVETHERFVDNESKETVEELLESIKAQGVNVYGDWG
tara:strand:- start:389 stop:1009 length:621 start_codon:yes stop_codon:yes gene_type:complete